MGLLTEINKYFRTRKGLIGDWKTYRNSGLFEFYGNTCGPTVFTEDTSLDFIGIDRNGYFYDEIYYPYPNIEKVGTIIPTNFLEQGFVSCTPNEIWKDVAEKGYHILDDILIDKYLIDETLNEAFIPHGINPALNMAKSIYHAYFATLADYSNPEEHKHPEYMSNITKQCLQQIPKGNPMVNTYQLHTTDIVKYLYDPSDSNSTHGPYSFHMDWFGRCTYMFFLYFAKQAPIEGRELLVGQRDDFKDFSSEALDFSPESQPVENSPFEKVDDDRVICFDTIPIKHGRVVLMNTLNPMFVHKVQKLKTKNEVILLTSYCWSRKWTPLD